MYQTKATPGELRETYYGPTGSGVSQRVKVPRASLAGRGKTDTISRTRMWPFVVHQTLHAGFRFSGSSGDIKWSTSEDWRPWQYFWEGAAFNVNSGQDFGLGQWFDTYGARLPSDYERNILRTRLLSNLKKSSSNIAVTLAEGAKTVSWMSSRTISLCNALIALKRGRFGDFVAAVNATRPPPPPRVRRPSRLPPLRIRSNRWGRNASGRWLEFQYALMPIVYDVAGAMETLRSWHDEVPDSILMKARGNFRFPVSGEGWYNVNSVGGPRIQLHFQQMGFSSGRCVVYYDVNLRSLRAASRIGLTNPASVAWELVPFSFVVDWVAPIGTYLDNLSSDLGLLFRSGYELWLSDVQSEASGAIRDEGAYPAHTLLVNSKPYCFTRGHVRVPLRDFPTAMPYVRNPLSVSNSVTALALLRQMWRFR